MGFLFYGESKQARNWEAMRLFFSFFPFFLHISKKSCNFARKID